MTNLVNQNSFYSTDSNRSPLSSNYLKTVAFNKKLKLEKGGFLEQVEVAYETYGKLTAQQDNAILICHAITGDSHVAKHDKDDIVGWWDTVVGPCKYVDTNKYYIICSNILGSCRGTTGPHSINPSTQKIFGKDFPRITVGDMVTTQNWLIEFLGIDRLFCVIGGSLGGFQVLEWAVKFPEKVKGAVVLASSACLSSQALAFDIIGRNAIFRDPYYNKGQYYNQKNKPDDGLAIARMLGHITYLSKKSMQDKFDADRFSPQDIKTKFEKIFSVGSYLAHQSNKFVTRFDANSYIILSLAMDDFNLGGNKNKLQSQLKKTKCQWLILSYTSDWLFLSSQSKEIVNELVNLDKFVSYCNIPSNYGHDSFLLDSEAEKHGNLILGFFKSLSKDKLIKKKEKKIDSRKTSIFFKNRMDFQLILDLISPTAKVLELGCEDGKLLQRLNKNSIGIELEYRQVLATINKGLNVIHHDLNLGLTAFKNNKFDVAILSQTLQSITNVEFLLNEMLRVAKESIISFPNFAFRPLREIFYNQGRLPKAKGWYNYYWYNTPNKRFPSILDFQEFCQKRNIKIKTSIFLDSKSKTRIVENPNLNAENAVFLIAKK